MNDNLTGLLDGKELVLRVVLATRLWRRNALPAEVIVRAVEALVAHADNLLVANVTDNVLVDRASLDLRRTGMASVTQSLRIALAVVGTDLVVLCAVSGSRHREESVRGVVLVPDFSTRETSGAKVVVYYKA